MDMLDWMLAQKIIGSHKEGNFPTPSGKCQLILRGVNNFVAAPFRQMYEGYQPGQPLPALPDYVPPRSRRRIIRS